MCMPNRRALYNIQLKVICVDTYIIIVYNNSIIIIVYNIYIIFKIKFLHTTHSTDNMQVTQRKERE